MVYIKNKAVIKLLVLLSLISSMAHSSQLSIGLGSKIDFGSASLNSNSLTLINNGQVSFGSAIHQIADFNNNSNAFGETSNINLNRDWNNSGTFNAQNSTVTFSGLSPTSLITGDTTFHNLQAITTTPKSLIFEGGSIQSILNDLTLVGNAGNLLTITSSLTPRIVYFALNSAATQTIDFVNISYNHGISQHIAPGSIASFNSVQGPFVRGWFLTSLIQIIPTLNIVSILLLIFTLLIISKKFLIIKNHGETNE